MNRRPPRILVVGAGVAGLACALRLRLRECHVELVGQGASASAAAAGMIAPASEAMLDEAGPETAELWRRAGSAWPAYSSRFGLGLRAAGALHLAEREDLEKLAAAALRLGFTAHLTTDGLWAPEDAHLDALQALARLEAAAAQAGVVRRNAMATVHDSRLLIGGEPPQADLVVLAAGWGGAGLGGAAPELAVLSPIKGQLLRFQTSSDPGGPVLRGPDVYLAPGDAGWTGGATMEPGRQDLSPDPARLADLRSAAARLAPELATATATPAVGVRATTPDEAPLVGPSRSGRVILATGLRRNGWLLAPLVAEAVAAYALDEDPDRVLGGQAHAWSPARFPI